MIAELGKKNMRRYLHYEKKAKCLIPYSGNVTKGQIYWVETFDSIEGEDLYNIYATATSTKLLENSKTRRWEIIENEAPKITFVSVRYITDTHYCLLYQSDFS